MSLTSASFEAVESLCHRKVDKIYCQLPFLSDFYLFSYKIIFLLFNNVKGFQDMVILNVNKVCFNWSLNTYGIQKYILSFPYCEANLTFHFFLEEEHSAPKSNRSAYSVDYWQQIFFKSSKIFLQICSQFQYLIKLNTEVNSSWTNYILRVSLLC